MYQTIINPQTKQQYSIYSQQGKQLLKQYINLYKEGGMMNQEDKDRMYTFLLSTQKKNQQAQQNQTFNPVGVTSKNVSQNIKSFINNRFNYTNEQLQYIRDHNLDINAADDNGNINCHGDMDGSHNCFNCSNCTYCEDCINCEDCQDCQKCNDCTNCLEFCSNCINCTNCEICVNCVN